MPFTLTHAVLAVPIARLSRHYLPTAALAIGCMLPDLHRLFMSGQFPLAHQWQGIWKFNLWLGYGFCALWYALLRPTLYDALGLHHPLPYQHARQWLRFIVAIGVGLAIGNATHLIWDGLTHVDSRTFAFHQILSTSIHIGTSSFPLHRLLQVGTSILFFPIVLYMVWAYWREHASGQISHAHKCYFGLSTLLIVVMSPYSAFDYASYFSHSQWQQHTYYVTGRCINELFQTALRLTIALSVLYQLLKWAGILQQEHNKT